MRNTCSCWSALKIHISEECYRILAGCAKHSYIMTLRGDIDIQVVWDLCTDSVWK